mgnify:CR=1 FL=1
MKTKIVFKTKEEFSRWIDVANMFAKSRINSIVALKQFNQLSAIQRTNIKKMVGEYDEKRRIKIPKEDMEYAWDILVMVDAHIIATEYNIDPLTVMMCLNAPCKNNERVIVK